MSIANNFKGLPIEDLIVGPLTGVAKGQAQLNDITWKYISEVAFEPPVSGSTHRKSRKIDVELNRYIKDTETGKLKLQQIHSMIPMLPLVPLPTLAVTSADVDFTMEVNESSLSKSSHDSSFETSVQASGGFWGVKFKASMSGKVATHKENTRKTDNSAKYNVKVHAEQLPQTEGMGKLNDMLHMMMEPTVVGMQDTEGGPVTVTSGSNA